MAETSRKFRFVGDEKVLEWSLVKDGPCAYCGTFIPDEAVPYRLVSADTFGTALVANFCDACTAKHLHIAFPPTAEDV